MEVLGVLLKVVVHESTRRYSPQKADKKKNLYVPTSSIKGLISQRACPQNQAVSMGPK